MGLRISIMNYCSKILIMQLNFSVGKIQLQFQNQISAFYIFFYCFSVLRKYKAKAAKIGKEAYKLILTLLV